MEAPKDDPADLTSGLFAARAQRTSAVNWMIGILLVVVAFSTWPTETRKLEKRAAQFVDAAHRGDAAGSYEYLAPATRQRISLREWTAAVSSWRTRSEVLAATVADSGNAGSVTFSDTGKKSTTATSWARIDGTGYCEDALRAK